MTTLASHPQRNSIRLQLRQNQLLQGMSQAQWNELEPLLTVADYRKGEPLVREGDEEMQQFFILEGMLKRVVSNPQGREMILRFAAENEMDTSYAAWRLRTPVIPPETRLDITTPPTTDQSFAISPDARHLVFVAASKGVVDEVIQPHSTRRRSALGLRKLRNKSLANPWKKHDNIPL